jgi:hypothetical protein
MEHEASVASQDTDYNKAHHSSGGHATNGHRIWKLEDWAYGWRTRARPGRQGRPGDISRNQPAIPDSQLLKRGAGAGNRPMTQHLVTGGVGNSAIYCIRLSEPGARGKDLRQA